MLKARYYQTDGAQGGEQNLPEWLFDGVVNENVLHQVIKAYLSNQRQGTAAAKSRGQVAGGASKPWRQKGTGRARQGTIRAVQWAGGGVAFPPIPHSWRQRVPKKVRALARRSAFNARAQGERVVLVDALEFDAPKTKQLLGLFSAIGADGKILVLTDGPKENVYLSARNLPNVETRPFGQESVYDILWANVVVIEKAALDGAEPSEADRDAAAARDRGEPEVRSREREAADAQAERKKARRGHKKDGQADGSQGAGRHHRGRHRRRDREAAKGRRHVRLPGPVRLGRRREGPPGPRQPQDGPGPLRRALARAFGWSRRTGEGRRCVTSTT